jgi:hypothetical protein
MGEPRYDVYAVSIATNERRLLAQDMDDRNAEAVIKLAVMRRGVETEFYTKEERK